MESQDQELTMMIKEVELLLIELGETKHVLRGVTEELKEWKHIS